MATRMFRDARSRRRLSATVAALAAVFFACTAAAQDGIKVVKIEEDWELVVKEPDTATQAPQVGCVTSPLGDAEGLYAVFSVNHQTLPDYQAGGMQLQIWNSNEALASFKFPNDALLATPGETIRWTQKMRLHDGLLTFSIINGSSSTWGSFGGSGYLRGTVATSLENLNAYNPALTAEKSKVSYAANRVNTLTLKKVRAYTSTGDVVEIDSSRVVYQHD